MNSNKIITPEQVMGNRLDKLWQWAEDLGQSLPRMEQNIGGALTSLQHQINSIIIALKTAGILTDEQLAEASEEARKFMEEKHKEALQEQEEQIKAASGPKIVSAEELENLKD